jgi:molybdate transport repressor ModE-like protein
VSLALPPMNSKWQSSGGMSNSSDFFQLAIGSAYANNPARMAHPLFDVLETLHQTGSISKAAKRLGRSYRHVWGELKHWEHELNTSLVVWGRSGKGAGLTPDAIQFLGAISKTQTDLAPQVAHIKSCFEQCFSVLKNKREAPYVKH